MALLSFHSSRAPAESFHPLARELSRTIEGEVRFDTSSRALYATDASNHRQVPIGVVVPRTIDDVIATVAAARRHSVALLPRGGGTSLAGQCCNVAVVIDFSKHLGGIVDIDPERRLARVEPGCVLDRLQAAAEPHGLIFGPDPSTHSHNTLGGMIGNNSGGVHSVVAGLTVDNVESLDVLTYDGTRLTVGATDESRWISMANAIDRRADIYRRLHAFRDHYAEAIRAGFPELPRRVSGYSNLDWLLPEKGGHIARALVGTEATCVVVLGATLQLLANPPCRIVVVLGFPTIFDAADAVPRVLKHEPMAIEGIEEQLIAFMREKQLHVDQLDLLPAGGGWLVVEFGATDESDTRRQAQELIDDIGNREGVAVRLLQRASERRGIQLVRESGLGATAFVPGQSDTWPGWEDSAVPREQLGAYMRELRRLLERYGYTAAMYGHFGDGLVHCRINFDLVTECGIERWRHFLDAAAALVIRHGGSLSGEHGDGEARGRLLRTMYGDELVRAFGEFKAIWDPDGKMNPGKVVDPFPITANLRLGPDYDPPDVSTYFSYPHDGHRFARATLRCVGVGKCRRPRIDEGVMCPSYAATRDEEHSTRGRARLLFEMLRGDALQQRWHNRDVEHALDLCLACKGCKRDCPVNVDMAIYKAEFRAHHYAHRLRPRAAYSLGMIHRWARLGGAMPVVANMFASAPGLSVAAKWLADIAQARTLPHFARPPFTRWFRQRRTPTASSGPRVVLWPDTFNNFFTDHVARAATFTLQRAGFNVVVPDRTLCCGRALYDWGMLDTAKSLLRQTMETLEPELDAGTPVVGLEPACISAFHEELPLLFPNDPRAHRLAQQSELFDAFVDRHWPRFTSALTERQPRKALVQIHCHHHASLDPDAERRVLEKLQIKIAMQPTGCCGMAGGFGFESKKYALSQQIAEQALLPALRSAEPDAVLVADGFSCREQIRQLGGRTAWHLAEVLAAQMVS